MILWCEPLLNLFGTKGGENIFRSLSDPYYECFHYDCLFLNYFSYVTC